MTSAAVPRVSGGEEELGHLEELRTDPLGLMQRVRYECGEVGMFRLADRDVILLTGAEANEFFFRSTDEDLNQAEAYPFMTPIFGEGVVFDASRERRKEMLHNSALRGEQMKGHAARIEAEVRTMTADRGDAGEINLPDFFADLTICTRPRASSGRSSATRSTIVSPSTTTVWSAAPIRFALSTPISRSKASRSATHRERSWSNWSRIRPVDNKYHGEFRLDHCGALVDLEPMGEDYVHGMCHTIEDPTFDATASATNRRAHVRPIHRLPRVPSNRHPYCAWTATIDDEHPEVAKPGGLEEMRRTRIATLELELIDRTQDGRGNYTGDLRGDIDFRVFSHSALVRLADEMCVEMHLLALGYLRAQLRCESPKARSMFTAQLTGWSAFAAERLRDALGVKPDAEGAMRVLELHPLLNPAAYVTATFGHHTVSVTPSPAHEDSAWISLVVPEEVRPLQAIVRAVSPTLDVDVVGDHDRWTARITDGHEPAPESKEITLAKFGSGSMWSFIERRSIPLTVL